MVSNNPRIPSEDFYARKGFNAVLSSITDKGFLKELSVIEIIANGDNHGAFYISSTVGYVYP